MTTVASFCAKFGVAAELAAIHGADVEGNENVRVRVTWAALAGVDPPGLLPGWDDPVPSPPSGEEGAVEGGAVEAATKTALGMAAGIAFNSGVWGLALSNMPGYGEALRVAQGLVASEIHTVAAAANGLFAPFSRPVPKEHWEGVPRSWALVRLLRLADNCAGFALHQLVRAMLFLRWLVVQLASFAVACLFAIWNGVFSSSFPGLGWQWSWLTARWGRGGQQQEQGQQGEEEGEL